MADAVVLPWIYWFFSSMKRWGLWPYHGLRRNTSTPTSTSLSSVTTAASTHTSVETRTWAGLTHQPTTYWDIDSGHANPRSGVATVRRQPRRRKTATGIRQDGSGRAPTAGPAAHTLNLDEPGTTEKPPFLHRAFRSGIIECEPAVPDSLSEREPKSAMIASPDADDRKPLNVQFDDYLENRAHPNYGPCGCPRQKS